MLDFLIGEYRGGVIKRHIAILLICRCRDRMVVGLQLPVQSVPITTINVSSNRARRCARNSVERGVKHHSTNPELIWGFITELIKDNKNILSRSFNLVSILVYARCLNIVFTYNFVYSKELEIEDTTDTRQATSYLYSVTLKPIFIMYNTYFYTFIPYPFALKFQRNILYQGKWFILSWLSR